MRLELGLGKGCMPMSVALQVPLEIEKAASSRTPP
jgi:hypothetical protein